MPDRKRCSAGGGFEEGLVGVHGLMIAQGRGKNSQDEWDKRDEQDESWRGGERIDF